MINKNKIMTNNEVVLDESKHLFWFSPTGHNLHCIGDSSSVIKYDSTGLDLPNRCTSKYILS